ncbi:hypothetical protein [Bradyrhizobium glycinis]|uniref:hypothetical protein n=1 Tax=Bradyrhizobium glycinis TaxID=2751812 RepID=UPI0018D820E4|nr:hypothetical protein [Bradyrhizobium glycinis]MBH5372966.1 hypothetical protein [Bradyrhizobium glycinis]
MFGPVVSEERWRKLRVHQNDIGGYLIEDAQASVDGMDDIVKPLTMKHCVGADFPNDECRTLVNDVTLEAR